MRLGHISLFLLIVITTWGCATSPDRHLNFPPTTFERYLIKEMVKHLELHNQKVSTIKSLGTLKVITPFWTKSSDAILLVKRSGWLKLQSLDDLGQPRNQSLIAHGELEYFDAFYQEWKRGKASRETIREKMHMDLHPQELFLLLTGGIPLESSPEDYRLVLSPNHAPYEKIELIGTTSQIMIDPHTLLPQKVVLKDENGKRRIRIEYFYNPLPNKDFPNMIKASLNTVGVYIHFVFTDVITNARLGQKLFKLDIPKGIQPQPL
jgi:hypothetical protein